MNEPKETVVTPASKGLKVGAALTWLFVWPIIMAVLAIGLLFLGGQILGGSTTEQPNSAAIRGYFFLFLIIMVVVCLVASKLQKRSKHIFVRLGSTVLTSYMWAGMLVGGFILAIMSDTSLTDTNGGINAQTASSIVVPALEHDPTIVAVLQQIGATHIGAIDERYVDGYNEKLTDQQGKYEAYVNPTTGDFLYGTLTVKRGLDKNEEKTMIAHEYLHHIWFAVLDEPTKENLTSHLITLYGKDLWMQDRVKEYSDGGILQPTELFSYYCTESTDGYLTTYIKDRCNSYVNRANLVMLR